MNRTVIRRTLLALVAAPLSLALTACGGSADKGGGADGEPIAKIAPPAGKAWADMVVKTPEGGYRMGNPDAPIKVIEFGALSCSHCAEFSNESSTELIGDFIASGRVSFELRLFMLNALDMPAALLVTCGPPETVPALAKQFWSWQGTMFQTLQAVPETQMQAISNQPPPTQFASMAKVTGMDQFVNARGIAADQATACLADTKQATALAQQTEQASKEFNITGTPTFLINGAKAEIGRWSEMKAKLQAMGAR